MKVNNNLSPGYCYENVVADQRNKYNEMLILPLICHWLSNIVLNSWVDQVTKRQNGYFINKPNADWDVIV